MKIYSKLVQRHEDALSMFTLAKQKLASVLGDLQDARAQVGVEMNALKEREQFLDAQYASSMASYKAILKVLDE